MTNLPGGRLPFEAGWAAPPLEVGSSVIRVDNMTYAGTVSAMQYMLESGGITINDARTGFANYGTASLILESSGLMPVLGSTADATWFATTCSYCRCAVPARAVKCSTCGAPQD